MYELFCLNFCIPSFIILIVLYALLVLKGIKAVSMYTSCIFMKWRTHDILRGRGLARNSFVSGGGGGGGGEIVV